MNSALPWQRLLMVPCTAVALAALQPLEPSAKAHTLEVSTSPQLSPAPRRALFLAQREWELNSFARRRSMWRDERRCIQRASSRWALQRCKDDYARAFSRLERDRRRALSRARRHWSSRHGSSISWREPRHGHPHPHRHQQPTLRVDWTR